MGYIRYIYIYIYIYIYNYEWPPQLYTRKKERKKGRKRIKERKEKRKKESAMDIPNQNYVFLMTQAFIMNMGYISYFNFICCCHNFNTFWHMQYIQIIH